MDFRDWSGNKKSTFVTLGASNHTEADRECHDYYATDPKALEKLLPYISLSSNVWEPSCGGGHLSKMLESKGYTVLSTDLVDRGYGTGGIDFLSQKNPFDGDIITNPPYKYALQFVKKALELVTNGHLVIMLLRLQFLEGKQRREFFDKYPPKYVYVSTSRISCAKNGKFSPSTVRAMAFAWFVWEKGCSDEPIIRWFN